MTRQVFVGYSLGMSTTTPTFPQTQNPTDRVAARFHELCSAGKWEQCMEELYADTCRHVEAFEFPGSDCKRITEGKAALRAQAERFNRTTTIHSSEVTKPWVNGDQFVCQMMMDCTSTEGPMANQRMQMSEICLYTVKNGKITEAKFFYAGCM